jgi:phage shock protein A
MSIIAAAADPNLSGFTVEGPMFWTLIVLIGCLVYMHSSQRSMERQAKMEAENGRRQEQTYQAMVQHYRQVVLEQQSRMDSPGHRSGSGGVEAVQLLVESNMQRSARLEARVETLAKELEQLRRTVAECEGTSATLFSSVSDLHHKMNDLNHAVMGLVDTA